MAVHLTRIYTKTGDDGTTALGDMSRVAKTSPRIAAFADVDEANAALGAAIALGGLSEDVRAVLLRVQNDLFDVGADLETLHGAMVGGAAEVGAGGAGPHIVICEGCVAVLGLAAVRIGVGASG